MKQYTIIPFIILVLGLSSCTSQNLKNEARKPSQESEALISFIDPLGNVIVRSAKDLKEEFGSSTVDVYNPTYKQTKSYEGVEFDKILKAMLGLPERILTQRFLDILKQYQIEITCADGYQPTLDVSYFQIGRTALLAYQEVEKSKPLRYSRTKVPWSIIRDGEKSTDPGPFYLVWNTKATYPEGWPFQVVKVRLYKK